MRRFNPPQWIRWRNMANKLLRTQLGKLLPQLFRPPMSALVGHEMSRASSAASERGIIPNPHTHFQDMARKADRTAVALGVTIALAIALLAGLVAKLATLL